MQVFTKAKKEEVEDEVLWKYNLLEIPLEIKDLWITLNFSLCKKNIKDSLNTWNIELMKRCTEYLDSKKIFVMVWDEQVPLNKYSLSLLVSDLCFSAFDCDKDVFLVDVQLPEEKLNKFKSENKEFIKELKTLQWEKSKKTDKKFNASSVSLDDILRAINGITIPNFPWLTNTWAGNDEQAVLSPNHKKQIKEDMKNVKSENRENTQRKRSTIDF